MSRIGRLPDLERCTGTKEKIQAYIEIIEDEKLLERIYNFIKYIYFFQK